MAIFRNVYMSFWTDAKVVDDFTPEDKYFYIYVLTNPHTNLCGCYEISFKQMSDELGYNKETIERLIDRFHKIHKVLAYNKDTKELLVYNWHKYNWTKSPKLKTALEREIPKVKCKRFNEYLAGLFGEEEVSIPYPYCMDTPDTDTDSNADSNAVKKKTARHKYGEYNNVLLTDEDMEKLKAEFPDWQERIERLSAYIAQSGKIYKNHLATIRNWARKDKEQKPKGRKEITPHWCMDDVDDELLKYRPKFPKTAADDESIRAKAEALRKELGGNG